MYYLSKGLEPSLAYAAGCDCSKYMGRALLQNLRCGLLYRFCGLLCRFCGLLCRFGRLGPP